VQHSACPVGTRTSRAASRTINLVTHCYGRKTLNAGDEAIISAMEHHSNIVPWAILCEEKAPFSVVPIDDAGEFCSMSLRNSSTRTKLVPSRMSALGTITPVRQIIDMAHHRHIPVLIDGA
jgi:cysteine desulfurase/selenocysteine lyase